MSLVLPGAPGEPAHRGRLRALPRAERRAGRGRRRVARAALWRLDTYWKALRSEVPWVKRPPSEYVADHVRLATQPIERPDDDAPPAADARDDGRQAPADVLQRLPALGLRLADARVPDAARRRARARSSRPTPASSTGCADGACTWSPAASELPPGERRIVEVEGRSIGVFNVGGTYYALRNACPHQGAPLCRGSVQGTARTAGPASTAGGARARSCAARGTAGSSTSRRAAASSTRTARA